MSLEGIEQIGNGRVAERFGINSDLIHFTGERRTIVFRPPIAQHEGSTGTYGHLSERQGFRTYPDAVYVQLGDAVGKCQGHMI